MTAPLPTGRVFIAHAAGNLVTIKTKDGPYPFAFASKPDGEVFLCAKKVPVELDILPDILRLNSSAVDSHTQLLYLPDRDAINRLATDPSFPASKYLITLAQDGSPTSGLGR